MSTDTTRRTFLAAAGAAAAGLAAPAALAQAAGATKPGGIRILGIACSSRKGKTTAAAIQAALDSARSADPAIAVELIELAGMKIDLTSVPDQPDDLAKLVEKLGDPKIAGIIVGTPVYMGTMTTLCKLLLDRCMVLRRNSFALRDKVGGALAVGGVRNGGQEITLQSVLMSMLCQDMVVVGDGRPTAHFGATLLNNGKDDISGDDFGLATARGLGKRVAEVALRMARA